MKVPCLVAPQGSNFYAKPIEGLFAVIDLNAGQVLEVVDTGVRPVPADEWGYTQAETEARVGSVRPLPNPAALAQPGGANYKLHGGQVTWDLWRFRLRVDKRPGVVLSQIEANDAEQVALGALPGAPVRGVRALHGPGRGLVLAHLHGQRRVRLRHLPHALAPRRRLPRLRHLPARDRAAGQRSARPRSPTPSASSSAASATPAWRHFEIFAQTPDKPVPAEGRPWTELVVRSASEIGNYDYLMDYVFQQNGMIRVMVGATGLDIVKGVASTSMSDPTAAADTAYGTLIAPNLVAPNHDHFFNYRLDFDVDGQANSLRAHGPGAAGDGRGPAAPLDLGDQGPDADDRARRPLPRRSHATRPCTTS